METAKIYIFSRKQKISEKYYSIPYLEYRKDGKICGAGYEDFTSKREDIIKCYSILIELPNETFGFGRKKWEEKRCVYVVNRKDALLFAKIKYPEQNIQVRKRF